MGFNLLLALFILLLRSFPDWPVEAPESWFLCLFDTSPFFEHLITFLYSIFQAHLILFLKGAILSRSAGSIYGGWYSENKTWVLGVLLALGVSAAMTSQQDSSSQSFGMTVPSGDIRQCLEVCGCHNWGDAAVIYWVEAKGIAKHPTLYRTGQRSPQQRCVYPRRQWCCSWEILS